MPGKPHDKKAGGNHHAPSFDRLGIGLSFFASIFAARFSANSLSLRVNESATKFSLQKSGALRRQSANRAVSALRSLQPGGAGVDRAFAGCYQIKPVGPIGLIGPIGHVYSGDVKMKRQAIAISLIVFSIALVAAMTATAQRQQSQTPPPAEYTVSGPYTHKNLTIFLLHGSNQSQGRAPLTLQEAMKRKLVVVRETGDVNRLTIQNRSNQDVFVQAGDIVKGGQQDRVLALDLIIPPRSGRIPIDAFCVEQGRWSRRGDEAVTAFSASNNALASKDLKIAAKAKASQSDVWANVGKAQEKLAANLAVTPTAMPVATTAPARVGRGVGSGSGSGSGAGNGAAQSPSVYRRWRDEDIRWIRSAGNGQTLAEQSGLTSRSDRVAMAEQSGLASRVSPSSLQLTLENKLVKDTANDYVKNLSSIIMGKRDVIGFVFAINGQINSADVYSSNALFVKLWPKMLEASAIEAIAELKADEKSQPVEADVVKGFLRESHAGKAETKKVTARTSMLKSETEKNLYFETRDLNRNKTWLHRNYLAK
jgi:ARG/rhodanese/phosphatase superfamily protein